MSKAYLTICVAGVRQLPCCWSDCNSGLHPLHQRLAFSTMFAHCVPLPAAGAPAIMTRSCCAAETACTCSATLGVSNSSCPSQPPNAPDAPPPDASKQQLREMKEVRRQQLRLSDKPLAEPGAMATGTHLAISAQQRDPGGPPGVHATAEGTASLLRMHWRLLEQHDTDINPHPTLLHACAACMGKILHGTFACPQIRSCSHAALATRQAALFQAALSWLPAQSFCCGLLGALQARAQPGAWWQRRRRCRGSLSSTAG